MDGGAWWAAVHGVARVEHHWTTSLSLFTFMLWRRKWQPTLVFLPGESQGQRSLVGCHLWGHTESDMTEATAAAAAGGVYMLTDSFFFFLTILNSYTPFTVITKYQLYSPCCNSKSLSLPYSQYFISPSLLPLYRLFTTSPNWYPSLFSRSVSLLLFCYIH